MYYNDNQYNYIVKNGTSGNGNQYKWTIASNTIRNNNQTSRYIRFNGTRWELTTTNSNRNIVYQITGPSTANITTPTITTGTDVIDELGSYPYTGSSTYTAPYYTMTGANTYYVIDGGTPQTNTTSFTSTTGITYEWALSDNTTDDGHVRIDSSTGELTYYNLYSDPVQTVGIKVTATHTDSGLSKTSATKTITLRAPAPTAITASTN